MPNNCYSSKDLASFRGQLRRDIADYIQSRSHGNIKYFDISEKHLHQESSQQNYPTNIKKLLSYMGKEELHLIIKLISIVESEETPHVMRDKIANIYKEMPKYFSFFFPIVNLSYKIQTLLVKYPREKILEIELENQDDFINSCNTKIKILTSEYQKNVQICENFSQKIQQLSTAESLDKTDILQQLNTEKLQCKEYRKIVTQQQNHLILLKQQNQTMLTENQLLKTEINTLSNLNQHLQDELKKLQHSYKELHQSYESCPIKTLNDLQQFKNSIVEEVIKQLNTNENAAVNLSKQPQGASLFTHNA